VIVFQITFMRSYDEITQYPASAPDMIARKLSTWFHLSRRERRLAINTIALMAFVRLGLWLAPFQKMQLVCGKLGHAGRGSRTSPLEKDEIVWTVRLASRYVPRATCLVQALATQVLLERNGHAGEVHIGVSLDAKLGFSAHAWVESQGKVLIGGAHELDRFRPMLVVDSKGLHGQPKHI
jgi:hypothetical protein